MRESSMHKAEHGWHINPSSPGQNSRRFADDIFGCIFGNEKFDENFTDVLKFFLKTPIDNNQAVV